jgi:hypothetical protein
VEAITIMTNFIDSKVNEFCAAVNGILPMEHDCIFIREMSKDEMT